MIVLTVCSATATCAHFRHVGRGPRKQSKALKRAILVQNGHRGTTTSAHSTEHPHRRACFSTHLQQMGLWQQLIRVMVAPHPSSWQKSWAHMKHECSSSSSVSYVVVDTTENSIRLRGPSWDIACMYPGVVCICGNFQRKWPRNHGEATTHRSRDHQCSR